MHRYEIERKIDYRSMFMANRHETGFSGFEQLRYVTCMSIFLNSCIDLL